MMFFRRRRLFTVLFALVSLLFMQLAVASYACPGTGSTGAAAASSAMPCAESMPRDMDVSNPGLCQAHCQSDHQSADKYELPVLPAMPAIAPSYALDVAISAIPSAPLQAPLLQRTTAPPLSVRNCCFRI